jgi:TetR/AcrR family transcriptional repressor of bet genes
MEPVRRKALVEATIHEIGRAGTLDVTVSQIAKRAGMSSALAHHYFGGKTQIFMAAMRHILSQYGLEVRRRLKKAKTHEERLRALVDANFAPSNFREEVVSAWMNFYVLAQNVEEARRLLTVYYHRLHSNLVHDLRPLVGDEAVIIARRIEAQIDGVYLRQSLRNEPANPATASDLVLGTHENELARCGAQRPAATLSLIAQKECSE